MRRRNRPFALQPVPETYSGPPASPTFEARLEIEALRQAELAEGTISRKIQRLSSYYSLHVTFDKDIPYWMWRLGAVQPGATPTIKDGQLVNTCVQIACGTGVPPADIGQIPGAYVLIVCTKLLKTMLSQLP